MSVEVSLTVGKLDASLALLTTKDHHVIEFPTMLLPDNIKAGSIVKIQVSQDLAEEKNQFKQFQLIQDTILEKYGSHKPEPPVLKILNVTQTSCVLEWEPLSLGSSQLKSLILYKQGARSLVIPNPSKTTATKISGLSVDTEYEFQLKLSTTSGQLWSEKVKVHTHKMTDMSGITVCVGPLDSLQGVTKNQIETSLSNIGAKALQDHVGLDTTHFICNEKDSEDPELEKAQNSNIPVVRPEWVRACELERRIVGVRGFYLDADPTNLESYRFSKGVTEVPQQEGGVTEEELQQAPETQSTAGETVAEEPDQKSEEIIPEPAQEVAEEPKEEVVPEPAQEIEPEAGQEVMEEPIEQVIPEPAQEVVPEPTEEVISEPAQEVEQEAEQEVIPEPAQEVSEESKQEVIPDPAQEIVEEPKEEVIPEPAQEVEPEAGQGVIPKPAQEIAEESKEATPNALSENGDADGDGDGDGDSNEDNGEPIQDATLPSNNGVQQSKNKNKKKKNKKRNKK